MDARVKLIEGDSSFLKGWRKWFRFSVKWICIYPGVLVFLYECYYWLRFATILDLQTYKIAPPKFLTFFYTFTDWEGVNVVIYSFLKLPIFVTAPVVVFILIFVSFYSALGLYHLTIDAGSLLRRLTGSLRRHRTDS
jgi:hypothetical protein